jgi:hypothetical protein
MLAASEPEVEEAYGSADLGRAFSASYTRRVDREGRATQAVWGFRIMGPADACRQRPQSGLPIHIDVAGCAGAPKQKPRRLLSGAPVFSSNSAYEANPIQRPPAATVTQVRIENRAIILASGVAASALPLYSSYPNRPIMSSVAAIMM